MTFLMLALACKTPPPTCAPKGGVYTVCAEEQVWQCPAGDADTVAHNQAIDDACNQDPDPVQCLLDAHDQYIMVDMTLTDDCAGGGEVCVEDDLSDPITATCQQSDSDTVP